MEARFVGGPLGGQRWKLEPGLHEVVVLEALPLDPVEWANPERPIDPLPIKRHLYVQDIDCPTVFRYAGET
jgi:hypothetical protein